MWLEDFRLACRAGGADDDLFIIQYLPLYLGESAQACLEQLPVNSIHLWVELKRIFMGNFQGTYVCPGNSWNLKACKPKMGDSTRVHPPLFQVV